MPEVFRKDIKRAARNIISYGDTDVFPYSFENVLIRKREEEFVNLIEDLAANFDRYVLEVPPQFENVLAPIGYTGYRWITQVDPYWNCYLLSAMIRNGLQIENARVDRAREVVHSYRYVDDSNVDHLFAEDQNWRSFMIKSHEAAQTHAFIVTTDISEFYRRIYHHRIENALERVCGNNLPDKIIAILGLYSKGTSYGLPIGGPAARMIAEIVLDQIDHLLLARGVKFARFVDDFHLFAESEEDAYKALQSLSELLILNQGLSLQKSKTRILTGSEFAATFPTHLKPGAEPTSDRERLFSVNLNYDPYSVTAAEDYEALKSSLLDIDFLALLNEELAKSQVHGPTISRLIKALKVTEGRVREQALITMMNNINILYPVLSQLLMVLKTIRLDLSEIEMKVVSERIIDLINSNSYIFSLEVHRCYATRLLYSYPDYRVDAIFTKWLYDGCPALKRDVLIAFAARKGWNHISDFKNRAVGQAPWVRRAMLAVSYGLGDEGKHWRQAQPKDVFDSFIVEAVANNPGLSYEDLL